MRCEYSSTINTMKNSFWPTLKLFVFLIVLLFVCVSVKAGDREIWILIDTESMDLRVMRGNTLIEIYENIAIGRNGADFHKRNGDDKTPLGSYRIGWINQKSRYHRFFGINYPSVKDAKRALKLNDIDLETFKTVVRRNVFEKIPPQNTVLGGQIGIHGIGEGDPLIHDSVNWTHGCIAVTNQQIDKLSRWIKKGILVQIR